MLTFFYGTCTNVFGPMAPKYSYLDLWFTLALFNLFTSGTLHLSIGLKFIEEPKDTVAVKGESSILDCSAVTPEGGPVVNITWYIDGQLVVSDARRRVLTNGSLFFEKTVRKSRKSLPVSDVGTYTCIATNSDETLAIISRKAHLSLAKLTRFEENPHSVTVKDGEAARFQCQISGLPTPDISWQKNKLALPHDPSRYTVLDSGVLQIHHVVQSDSGQYRCVAVNIVKSRASEEATLSVTTKTVDTEIPLQIVAGPKNTIVVEDEDVVLECLSQGLPSAAISWTKKSPSESGEEIRIVMGEHYSLVGKGNLNIRNLRASDTGLYTCHLSDVAASEPANLTVLVPPYPQSEPPTEGQTVKNPATTTRLTCQFGGYPSPDIYWTKNAKMISVEGGQLRLTRSTPQDSGMYQCHGKNMVGEAYITHRLLVVPNEHGPHAPKGVTVDVRSSTGVTISWEHSRSRDNNLTIVAYSIHYWATEGGSELQKVSEPKVNWLMIDTLQPYTNYSFYVVSYNKVSHSTPSTTVYARTDEAKPIAAPTITVTPYGSQGLKIKWKKLEVGKARGVITSSKVYYRLHNDPNVLSLAVDAAANGDYREYIINGLEANQKYDLRVKVGNKKGFPLLSDSDWPWVTQKTQGFHAKGVPDPPDIQVSALNDTALVVSWKMPSGVQSNRYMVTYQPIWNGVVDDNNTHTAFLNDVNSHIIGRLEPNTHYEVGVVAINGYGEGEPAVVTMKTLQSGLTEGNMPPPAPIHMECSSPMNNTTLSVKWQSPSFPSFPVQITQYTVRYRPLVEKEDDHATINQPEINFQYKSSKALQTMIKNLEPFTKYEFSVRAHTNSSTGLYSNSIKCQTLEGRPSAPLNPQASFVESDNMVKLVWQPPAQRNGIIVRYVINYRQVEQDILEMEEDLEQDMWHTKQENGTVTEAIVKELAQNAIYYFKLRAATLAGDGPPSKSIKVETTRMWGPMSNSGEDGEEHLPEGGSKELGIIIGACIGGTCIILCTLIFLLRNKYCPPTSSATPRPHVTHNGNGSMANGYGGGCGHHQYMLTNGQLLDASSTPIMMANHHCDTKGSDDYHLHLNGLMPMNGLQTNYHPNGEVTTFLTPLRSFQEQDHVAPPCEPRPVSQDMSCSLDDIDRTLNSDDLAECPEGDDNTRPSVGNLPQTLSGDPEVAEGCGPHTSEPGCQAAERQPDSMGEHPTTSIDSNPEGYSTGCNPIRPTTDTADGSLGRPLSTGHMENSSVPPPPHITDNGWGVMSTSTPVREGHHGSAPPSHNLSPLPVSGLVSHAGDRPTHRTSQDALSTPTTARELAPARDTHLV